DGTFTFTITSDKVASQDMTVRVNTADGTATLAGLDYTQVTNLLATITAGTTSTTVTVTVNNDAIVEDDETFTASISDPRFNGATDATRVVLGDGTGQATIQNNDTATLSINDISVSEDGTFTFTITSDKVASQDLTVRVNTANGTATLAGLDYTQVTNLLATITAGTTSTTVTVTVNNDAIVEDDETFTASLSDPRFNGAPDATRVVLGDGTGQATIQNNDTATLSINDISVSEDGTFPFTITSDKVASQDLTVRFNTANGTATLAGLDYTQVTNLLATITAGTTSTTVTVTVNDDAIVEDDETFTASLSDPRFNGATDATRVVLGDGTGQATIQNNDTATLSINDISVSEDGTFTFTITSDKVASQDLTVRVNTANGTATLAGLDYTQVTNLLATITAG